MVGQLCMIHVCSLNLASECRTSGFDKSLQTDRPLTSEELDIIQRLYKSENPDASYDPYEPMVEWFTGKGKQEIMPLSAAPEPKRRWVPSKWEKHKVVLKAGTGLDILVDILIGHENRSCHSTRTHCS